MEQKILTEKDLERLGFTCVKNDSYINGKQWFLQVTDDYVDKEAGEIINRDGTWFEAIGTWNFTKNGEMAVNTLCRGNYVCKSVTTIEDLQVLFFALKGSRLISDVSGYFSFAKYLNSWFVYHDNTERGDVYKNIVTEKIMTETEIIEQWNRLNNH